MRIRTLFWFGPLVTAIAVLLLWPGRPCPAADTPTAAAAAQETATQEAAKTTAERRREAQQRLESLLNKRGYELPNPQSAPTAGRSAEPIAQVGPPTGINPAVDISLPNWANSPSVRKFVDSIAGLGASAANNLGSYISVAVPDKTTFPGSDYYEIAVVEYTQKLHSDLPPTKLRGYVQLETPVIAAQSNHFALTYPGGGPIMDTANQPVFGMARPLYLGPTIVAPKGQPVRVKFVNYLPTGAGGNLFIPVDTTIMGSGHFHTEDALGNMIMGMFTQNRADLHLHGGLTPWISDGTPHQWITPAGENTMYPRGALAVNVPDMPDPGPNAMTYYWTNEQSSRLMFYHDHSWGITRLNVYAGEAAGYVVTDQVEEDLIMGSNLSGGNPGGTAVLPNLPGYKYGIPLIIQDKTFVNDATTPPGQGFPTATHTPTPQTGSVDPLWYTHIPNSKGGDLWFPHEYLPNENLYDPSGFWYMGRWDYGPWILPPMFPMNDVLPSPSHVPEAFMDTAVVNGTVFPYIELPPTAVRFRILNACNDRMLNLQLYKADPAGFKVTDTAGLLWGTEVKMVPAAPNPAAPTWPVDGRDGGVPDPASAGPDMIQIGNECGFIAKVAVIPAQPVDFDYDRTSATFGNVSSVSLFLPPAVRADVVVDLSAYQEGDTLILYNDAPEPTSLYDARYDYFTNGQDWTAKGGVAPVAPGFGPNTRTLMQIRIKGTTPAGALVGQPLVDAVTNALPKAFAAGQDAPLVPASIYNAAYNQNYPDIYANIADESLNLTGAPQGVARVVAELPGFGYTTPPTVTFYGGSGTGAAAVATLNGITGFNVLTSGSGYTSPPTVNIAGGGGNGATAVATVSGGVVTAITVTNPGSNYTTFPTVTLQGGGGTGATASANITLGSVGTINVTNPGSGYIKAPYVTLTGGGGTGATAVALLNGSLILDGKALVEGMDMEYGRMNAVLGTIPNPLNPAAGAGPVIGAAFYIDPPSDIIDPNQTYLWRIMHIGVDSHSLHFHLFNVQVVNRVDWTNTLKPPYEEEQGWKETIRTNPFEDIIVALRPSVSVMKLPFGIPESKRLLDPSMPLNSIGHFIPVPPPIGIPAVAQITNAMTNFAWEYVWHCHLLGHEENDMMRPLMFKVPSTIPGSPVLSGTVASAQANLTWTDPTPFNYATGLPTSTLGNPANEIGFRIERSVNGGAFTKLATALANATNYTDTTINATDAVSYRVIAYNAAGDSPASNTIGRNFAPVVQNQNVAATEGVTKTFTLTATDPDGPAPMTFALVTWPTNGTYSLNPTTGVVTYTANAGATTDSCTFTATDGLGAVSAPATVSITISPVSANNQSDDFNTCALRPFWTVSDPLGGANVRLTGRGTADALLEIDVPAGAVHDAWTTNTAVLVTQPADNVDFEIRAKFQAVFNAGYQGQGLIVQQDATNYLRFDVNFGGGTAFLYSATFAGTAATQRFYLPVTYGVPYYLSLQRAGDTCTARYSTNGTTWTVAGTFTWAATVTRVGLLASNFAETGPAPAFTSKVDYFLNPALPFSPQEDAPVTPATLTTSVVGSGSITVNPPGPTYTCGETVTLTAVPANGWTFTGWSGDLTGTVNPQTLAMTQSRTVTATFTGGGPNNAPVAQAQAVAATAGVAKLITLTATDPDGPPPLTFAIVTPPANGILGALNPTTGVVTYTANAGATTDSFTFTATDGASATSTPATVSITISAAQPNQSDDFNTCALNPFWTLVDPLGGGTAQITGVGTADALLNISVPAGASHDPWTVNEAVRVTQPATNGDFEIQTKLQATFNAGYQGQGLIVEQDAGTYLRFDVDYHGTGAFLYAATFGGGAATERLFLPVTYGVPYYLSAQRAGNTWTLRYSTNGTTWTNAASFNWTTTVNRVGLLGNNFAVSGSAPAFTAKFDYFLNVALPLTTEDGPRTCP